MKSTIVSLDFCTPSSKRAIEGVYLALRQERRINMDAEITKGFLAVIPKTPPKPGSNAEKERWEWMCKTKDALKNLGCHPSPDDVPPGWSRVFDLVASGQSAVPVFARLLYLKDGCGISHAVPTYQEMIKQFLADEEAAKKKKEVEAVYKTSLIYRYGKLLEDELRKEKASSKRTGNYSLLRKLRHGIFDAEDAFNEADKAGTGLTPTLIENIFSIGFVRTAKALIKEV